MEFDNEGDSQMPPLRSCESLVFLEDFLSFLGTQIIRF